MALLTAACAALAGCGDDDQPAEGAEGAAPLVATTSIWADVTANVACGEDVAAIIAAGADPHTFEPSLRDRELLESAGTVIANGNGLEGSLVDLLDTVAAEGTDVVEIVSDGGDPHVWQDPQRVAGALDAIAAAVVATGRDPAAIEACTDGYRAELESLDAEIAETLAPIPAERRVLVTSHDSLAYFADRYDMEIVGTVIPASNTLAETSAAGLAELAGIIAERHVPAVFTEELESTSDADALAERLGVAVVPLVTDALTADPPGDTYVGMMRANAGAIAGALTEPAARPD